MEIFPAKTRRAILAVRTEGFGIIQTVKYETVALPRENITGDC